VTTAINTNRAEKHWKYLLKRFGEFAPRIDAFLKEHLFADIFDSDVLNYQQRELATIAALSAMQGVEPQLQSHLAMGKNTGLTASQLKQVFSVIETHIGKKQAEVANKVLSKMTGVSNKGLSHNSSTIKN
jgi:alkylhydroperoxidase/carboxymuconolactone decarboxylase family protein YurZ